jgi:integrase
VAKRAVERLTALQAKRATTPGLLGDGKGLYLRVGDGGARSWVLRYMIDGRAREMGLGSYYDLSLAEARERARGFRRMVKDGVDPIDDRRLRRAALRAERAKAMTFRQCAEAYIAAHQAGWRSQKHRTQWPNSLETYVYPVFGDLPVQGVDIGLVMKAVEPIWTAKPETAGRVRGRIESILDWAATSGYRQGENPARWRGHLENLLPKKSKVWRVQHHAALPYDQLPEFVKAGKEHRVPLSDRAIALLKEMLTIGAGDFLFPGGKARRSISNMAMAMTLRRMGRAGLTVHGFRSTFSDWCSERTNFPAEVREMALAHSVSDKVEAAYRRGELLRKRRQLMAAWASYSATPASGADVIALAARRGAAPERSEPAGVA